jgi:hypothetical protein
MKVKNVPSVISRRDLIINQRRPLPPKGFAFKDKAKYTRKKKHRGSDENPLCVSFFA